VDTEVHPYHGPGSSSATPSGTMICQGEQ